MLQEDELRDAVLLVFCNKQVRGDITGLWLDGTHIQGKNFTGTQQLETTKTWPGLDGTHIREKTLQGPSSQRPLRLGMGLMAPTSGEKLYRDPVARDH